MVGKSLSLLMVLSYWGFICCHAWQPWGDVKSTVCVLREYIVQMLQEAALPESSEVDQ